MAPDTRENLFAFGLLGLLFAAVVAACCWHASIVDRSVDAYLSTRPAIAHTHHTTTGR